MPRIHWQRDLLKDLISEAEASGFSEAELSSLREAQLFRFALYNFRRKIDSGQNLTITTNDRRVTLTKNQVVVKRRGAAE